MALAHLVFGLSPICHTFGSGVLEERLWVLPSSSSGGAHSVCKGATGYPRGFSAETGSALSGKDVSGRARLKATEAPLEGEQIGGLVEIPVTCYQILGLPETAEKDEVAKAVIDLKGSEIEDGYTTEVIGTRQHLLMDLRDKLLFEPEYAGNIKEKVPPKSSLRIPWAWLPGALCLLQEVGEAKKVLDIGRAALRHSDVKPYIHDVLLSMALAECAIAKTAFEKNKVSDGFEAIAHAQYLLKSIVSLANMPLLSQIEESLEDLAPACTLELLGIPYNPDYADHRKGAIAALRELLRQGLDAETCCRVQDWHCFFGQAIQKLTAAEIVDLLSWVDLGTARKNKKSLESQNQRVVIDFKCFHLAMIAHLALGFSTRQIDLIIKAKTICECLIVSEAVDLKFEGAFCSVLLGKGDEAAAFEKLQQAENNRNSSQRSLATDNPKMVAKDKRTIYYSMEMWLKDAVLNVFPDTQDCSPSLANFFGGSKRIFKNNKSKIGSSAAPYTSNISQSFGLSNQNAAVEQCLMKSTAHMDEAVKQLATSAASLQIEHNANKIIDKASNQSNFQLKRKLGFHSSKFWESWNVTGDLMGRTTYTALLGCAIFGALKLLSMQFGQLRMSHFLFSSQSSLNPNALTWTDRNKPGLISNTFMKNGIFDRLGNIISKFKENSRLRAASENTQNLCPADNLSCLAMASSGFNTIAQRRHMPLEDAESLVKQWQDVKAEALGPYHRIHVLTDILSESMLSKWLDLASSAKKRGCFWRFVLLKLSIHRAEIVLNEIDFEMAELEAVVEEAAELVDESQPCKQCYYSTYKVQYILKKHDDDSWRICNGGVQTAS
ncbi:Plastid division protein CDP1, chloroplastic [Apostasia shenzhenica]|uniref:Plastid division protein CDP1, chloroplastic n=1 Tax=Apostasia shenzhenica TaxID=1088818 RepID=A0A2I0AHG9_9ASPA|nr:Plastid division protein CDP1, chloroplastic [Apostasia shenzhenica]